MPKQFLLTVAHPFCFYFRVQYFSQQQPTNSEYQHVTDMYFTLCAMCFDVSIVNEIRSSTVVPNIVEAVGQIDCTANK